MYKKNCIQCGGKNLKKIVNFGMQPWCNDHQNSLKKSLNVKKFPLKLMKCDNCQGGQLSFFVNKKKMFTKHDYISSSNKPLLDHFKKLSLKINKINKNKFKSILDIGSNDNSFLNCFDNSWKTYGVESCKKSIKNQLKKKHKIYNVFFNYNLVKKIKKEFDIIHASGVFFHLEEIYSATKAIKILLKKNGIFIVEFIYLKKIYENLNYDQIYHEHLFYYNIQSLSKLLERFDLQIFDTEKSRVHGGSIIAYIGHKGFVKETKRHKENIRQENIYLTKNKLKINKIQKDINNLISNLKRKILYYKKRNYKISVIGAPAKATVVINLLDKKTVKCISDCYEVNKNKIGKYIPGSDILIKNEKYLNVKDNRVFLILSWNYKKYILDKLFIKKNIKNIKVISPH